MDGALESHAAMPRMGTMRPCVVKLGGSVVRGSQLEPWLQVVADAKQPIVIVPGGGALADEVRHCQRRLGFDDVTAHRMALLAMDQLAWAVAGLRAGLEVGVTETDLQDILRRGRVAIWAPSGLIAGRPDVEAAWRLTSDSLAVWLAGRLDALSCCLLKSIALTGTNLSAGALADEGIVDAAFAEMVEGTQVPCAVFGQGDQAALAACFAQGAIPARHLIAPARTP